MDKINLIWWAAFSPLRCNFPMPPMSVCKLPGDVEIIERDFWPSYYYHSSSLSLLLLSLDIFYTLKKSKNSLQHVGGLMYPTRDFAPLSTSRAQQNVLKKIKQAKKQAQKEAVNVQTQTWTMAALRAVKSDREEKKPHNLNTSVSTWRVSASVSCTHRPDTSPPCQTCQCCVSGPAKPDELVIPFSVLWCLAASQVGNVSPSAVTSCVREPLEFGYRTYFALNCNCPICQRWTNPSCVCSARCPVNTQPFISALFNEQIGSGALKCLTPRHFAADKCFARSIILIRLIAGIALQSAFHDVHFLNLLCYLPVKRSRAKYWNEKAHIGSCSRQRGQLI